MEETHVDYGDDRRDARDDAERDDDLPIKSRVQGRQPAADADSEGSEQAQNKHFFRSSPVRGKEDTSLIRARGVGLGEKLDGELLHEGGRLRVHAHADDLRVQDVPQVVVAAEGERLRVVRQRRGHVAVGYVVPAGMAGASGSARFSVGGPLPFPGGHDAGTSRGRHGAHVDDPVENRPVGEHRLVRPAHEPVDAHGEGLVDDDERGALRLDVELQLVTLVLHAEGAVDVRQGWGGGRGTG